MDKDTFNSMAAFRVNCECGREVAVPHSAFKGNPIYCECGRSYWYDPSLGQHEQKNNPIVFLDIDGVLVTTRSLTRADPECVRALNHLTRQLDAVLVVTSTRREIGKAKITQYLRDCGVTGTIVGITPELSGLEGDKWRFVERGKEIQAWLDRNKRQFQESVVIDDESDLAHLLELNRFIQTESNIGLTEAHVQQALDMFGVSPE